MAELTVRRLSSRDAEFETQLAELTAWDAAEDQPIARAAREIVDAVRERGDAAVLDYTQRFDRVACSRVADLAIDAAELAECAARLSAADRRALEAAARRIRAFHEAQRTEGF